MEIEIEKPVHTYLAYSDFIKEAEYYSKLNVICLSLFSGCGIPYEFTQEKLSKLFKKDRNINLSLIEGVINEIKPICAVFPQCDQNGKLLKNKNKYFDSLFKNGNYNKYINLSDQAYSIIGDIKISKLLYNEANSDNVTEDIRQNRMAISLLLYKLAIEKSKFICSNLKNEEGLFVNKELLTKDNTNRFKPLILGNEVSDNALVIESLIELAQTLNDVKYPFFQNIRYLDILSQNVDVVFKSLVNISEKLFSLSTKSIIQITNSLLKLHNFTYNYENEKQCFNMIIKCCGELQSRISDLKKIPSFQSHKSIDLIVCFKIIRVFINSYLCTGIEKFKDSALGLYNNLESYYDTDIKFYYEIGRKNLKFYADEISSIINSLYWVSTIDKTKEKIIQERITHIFEICFDKCRVMLGTNLSNCSRYIGSFLDEYEENALADYENLESELVGNKITEPLPVFCSSMKFQIKKDRIISQDSSICPGRSFRAASELLEVIEGSI